LVVVPPLLTAGMFVTYCNTLQHAATHCKTLQHIARYTHTKPRSKKMIRCCSSSHNCRYVRDVLQHAATCCNMLQHAATRCNMLQHAATCCNTLQHIARYMHTKPRSRKMFVVVPPLLTAGMFVTSCSTLQHAATCCNTR